MSGTTPRLYAALLEPQIWLELLSGRIDSATPKSFWHGGVVLLSQVEATDSWELQCTLTPSPDYGSQRFVRLADALYLVARSVRSLFDYPPPFLKLALPNILNNGNREGMHPPQRPRSWSKLPIQRS